MSDDLSDRPTFSDGDLDPDVDYADPWKDLAAHQYPRNEADRQELAADYARLGVRPIIDGETPPPVTEGPTMEAAGPHYEWEPPEPWSPYDEPHIDPEPPEIVGD